MMPPAGPVSPQEYSIPLSQGPLLLLPSNGGPDDAGAAVGSTGTGAEDCDGPVDATGGLADAGDPDSGAADAGTSSCAAPDGLDAVEAHPDMPKIVTAIPMVKSFVPVLIPCPTLIDYRDAHHPATTWTQYSNDQFPGPRNN